MDNFFEKFIGVAILVFLFIGCASLIFIPFSVNIASWLMTIEVYYLCLVILPMGLIAIVRAIISVIFNR